jgi:hypothetical protein
VEDVVVSESPTSVEGEDDDPRAVNMSEEEFPERRSAGSLSLADLERFDSLWWRVCPRAASRDSGEGSRVGFWGRILKVGGCGGSYGLGVWRKSGLQIVGNFVGSAAAVEEEEVVVMAAAWMAQGWL